MPGTRPGELNKFLPKIWNHRDSARWHRIRNDTLRED
jgi:hypothetical protein